MKKILSAALLGATTRVAASALAQTTPKPPAKPAKPAPKKKTAKPAAKPQPVQPAATQIR